MEKKKGGRFTDRVLSAEYEAVYRYVLCLCRDDTAAKDITQETFLKAMKGADSFARDSSLYTWLCAIAKRIWLNTVKSQSREGPSDFSGDISDESKMSLEEAVSEKDTAMYIHRLVHQLEEPYKEVFLLRALGELSFRQIGELFGKTENWACVTYHRARKKLQKEETP